MNNEEFNDLLTSLEDIEQKNHWTEDIPSEIWEKHFKDNYTVLKRGLDVDKHRWYETSTTVIKIYDRILGINFISDTFSEGTEISDCYSKISFFEMEEVKTITYKMK